MDWTNLFVVANVLQFAFGVAITGVSYYAYRSSGKKSLRNSTVGFLCITVGGVLAPVYELGVKADYHITAQELLKLQIIEGTVISLGIGLLLFSVYSHDVGPRRVRRIEFDVPEDGRGNDR